jgi:hypothetical protein
VQPGGMRGCATSPDSPPARLALARVVDKGDGGKRQQSPDSDRDVMRAADATLWRPTVVLRFLQHDQADRMRAWSESSSGAPLSRRQTAAFPAADTDARAAAGCERAGSRSA